MHTRRELRPRNVHSKRLEHLDLHEAAYNIKSKCEIGGYSQHRLPDLHSTTHSLLTQSTTTVELIDLQRRASSTPCSSSSEKENRAQLSGEHEDHSPLSVPSSNSDSSSSSSTSSTSPSSGAFTSLINSNTTPIDTRTQKPEIKSIASFSPPVVDSSIIQLHPAQQAPAHHLKNQLLLENGVTERISSIGDLSTTATLSPPQPLPQVLLPQLSASALPSTLSASVLPTLSSSATSQPPIVGTCLPASCIPLPPGKTSSTSTTSDWPFQVQKNLVLAERILNDENEFNRQLFRFMKSISRPIHRVPHLGFKKLNLFAFFRLSLRLGGYQWITWNRNWKRIYDSLGGDQKSTSAATCTRRHYEALLLPFERYVQQLRGKSGSPIKEVTKLQRGRKPKILIERSEQIERLVQLELDNQAPLLELENLDHNSLDALTERLMGGTKASNNSCPSTTASTNALINQHIITPRTAILPSSVTPIIAGIPLHMSSHSPPHRPTLPACTLPSMVFNSSTNLTQSSNNSTEAFGETQRNKMFPPHAFLEQQQATRLAMAAQHLSADNHFNQSNVNHTHHPVPSPSLSSSPSSSLAFDSRLSNGMINPLNENVARQTTMDAPFDANLLFPRKRGRKPKYMKEMEQQLQDNCRPRMGSFDSATLAAMTRLNAFNNNERSPTMTAGHHFGQMPFNDKNVPLASGNFDVAQPLGRMRSQSFGSHREVSQQQMNDEQIVRMLEQRYVAHRQRTNSHGGHRNGSVDRSASPHEPNESRLASELEYLKNRYHQLEQLQQLQQQKEHHQKQHLQKLHQQKSHMLKAEVQHKKESELLSSSSATTPVKSGSVSPLPPNKRRLSEMADQVHMYANDQQSPVLDLTMPKKKATNQNNHHHTQQQRSPDIGNKPETNEIHLESIQSKPSIGNQSSPMLGDAGGHGNNTLTIRNVDYATSSSSATETLDSLKSPDLNNNQSAIQAAANEYLLRCYQQLLSAQQNAAVGGLIANYPSNFSFIGHQQPQQQQPSTLSSHVVNTNGSSSSSTTATGDSPTQDLKHSIPNLCAGLSSSADATACYKQFLPSFPF